MEGNTIAIACVLGFLMFPGVFIILGLFNMTSPYKTTRERGKKEAMHYSGLEDAVKYIEIGKKASKSSGYKGMWEVTHAYRTGEIDREELEYWKKQFSRH